jgi:hypothetical protein
MSFLNDLAVGLRGKLRAAGLTVPAPTAAVTDNTVVLTVALINGPDDADQEGRLNATGAGAVDIRVTCLIRSNRTGDTQWLGDTSETIARVLGTIRNETINGCPVSWVHYQYGTDLGIGDLGRPEASENYTVRAARPALV